MTLIFVYGTLKKCGTNHRFLSRQGFVGSARTVPGFALYQLDGFPGMVADPADAEGVTGELWNVDDECLAELDQLEGLPEGLYRREPVALLAPHAAENAQTYFYGRSVDGCPRAGSSWPV